MPSGIISGRHMSDSNLPEWEHLLSDGAVEVAMILEYISKAIERTTYKKLDDGSWFAEIPGFDGVWANAQTVESCRKELIEVLEEWLLLKVCDRDEIPAVHGVHLRITKDSAS